MGYQILRFEKIKTRQALEGRCKHATRERMPENADPALKWRNQVDRSTQDTLEAFDQRLSQLPKIRKDNVRAVEIMVGFSPEETKRLSEVDQFRYLDEAKLFFTKLFGGAQNCLNATIHCDEKTSRHLTLFVMPIQAVRDEKTNEVLGEKLNCKHWLGGAWRLSLLQTRFHDEVAVRFGLERGVHGSKAKHEEVDRHYARVQAAETNAVIPEAEPPKHRPFIDPNSEIKEAVEKRDAQLQPKIEALAAKAQRAEELRKENKALKLELAAKDKHIARLNEKIAKLQKWIGEVKEVIIQGGARLAALVKDLLKERETVTINSPGALEKGRAMLDAARKGGAKEVKAAGDFFLAVREASLPILIEEMADVHNRKLSLQDARFRYDLDEDPSIATRMKPFRNQRLELGAIAREKGLTIEGKGIKIERGGYER